MPLKLSAHEAGVVLAVKVVPNSSRDAIVGLLGDALKIKVAKPPEGGAANRGVEQLLARTLGVAPGQVSVIAGHTQPRKQVLIRGMTMAAVEALLGA